MNTLGAVVSTSHLSLKLPISPTEVGVIHADQKEAQHCYNESLKIKGKEQGRGGTREVHMVKVDQPIKMNMRDLDPREEGRARPESNDELQKIQIRTMPQKFTFVRLPKAMKAELISLLQRNSNLFAWALNNMLGINPRIICHKLAIDPKV